MNIHIDDLNNLADPHAWTDATATLWVPSARLAAHRTPVPSAPKRKWRELLPWLLEDRVLEPVDSLHFVMAGSNPDDSLTVLVTSRAQMASWIEQADSAGLGMYRLLPDYMALPWQPGQISVARRGDEVLVRHSSYEGFAAPPAIAWRLVEKILRQQRQVTLWAALLEAEVRDALPESASLTIDAGHTLDWQRDAQAGVDLLTGDFARTRPITIDKRWLATAALLVLALVITYAAVIQGNQNLREEIASLESAQRRALSAWFPDLTVTDGNVRAAVQEVIAGRFRQRESLEAPAMAMLADLDSLVSACECQVDSIELTPAGLRMTLSGAAGVLGSTALPGYRLSVTSLEEGRTQLVMQAESTQ